MSAFIIRRGGGTSAGSGEDVITGTFTVSSTSGNVTVHDLIGKSRFVIDAAHQGSGSARIVFIRYIDGNIVQYGKSGYNVTNKTYDAGTDESAAYFDPATGTINAYSVTKVFWCTDEYEYTYTIFG